MLARLLLALLLAAFALPALANGPCHDAPMAAMAATMPSRPHPAPQRGDSMPASHVCICCIPLAGLAAPTALAPVTGAAVPRLIVSAAFDPASGTAPVLPPPRHTA